jgi:sarcosine oxidase subunit beta
MSIKPNLPNGSDVVIVGGGIIGTSVGYFLTTETDLDVTLVEQDSIAAGSTGDSSAIIRHHYGEREIYTRMAWWSHEFYRQFESEVGEPIAHEENPRVVFAAEESDDAAYATAGQEILETQDIPVRRYDCDEFNDLFPMLNLEKFDFGVSDETAAFSDGTDVATGFARAMTEAGATVVTGTSVEGFSVDDDRITGVHTDDGTVDCDRVVTAAGPWTARLMADLGIDLPLVTEREQVVLLDPPDGFLDDYSENVPTAGLPGGYYMRPEFGESVLVATHHSGDEVDPDSYDNQPNEETLLDLYERVADFVPDLRDAGVQGGYSGIYTNTPDHDFIIDECGLDGCYVACGFSGHGFKNAPAVGQLVTDLVTDADSSLVDIDHFSLSRFTENETGHGGGIEY